jgi:hypothetical protein
MAKPVATNVIGGRVNEQQFNSQEQIDFLGRQISYKTMQVNSANSLISTMISLTGQDYSMARQAYQDTFSNNLAVHQQLHSEQTEERQFASANLGIWMDLISKGQVTYDTLDPAQKVELSKLEVQAGFPVGFLSTVKIPPGSNIKDISYREANGTKYADILYVNPDGSIKVVNQAVGSVPKTVSSGGSGSSRTTGSGTTKVTETQINAALKIIKEVDKAVNEDGQISDEEYATIVDRMGGDNTAADVVDAALTRGGYTNWKAPSQTASKSDKDNATNSVNDAMSSGDAARLWQTLTDAGTILTGNDNTIKAGWAKWHQLTGQ